MDLQQHECQDCGLGLKFSTAEELKNHQLKFCNNSHYNDPHKMDARLAGLKQPDLNNIKMPLGDIREYIQGKGLNSNNQATADAPSIPFNLDTLNTDPFALRNQPKALNTSYADDPGMTDLEKQVLDMKDNNMHRRLQREQTKSNVSELLQDLQKRKEIELRAQIEKEEIARAVKATQQRGGDMSAFERQRKQELEKLAKQREAVRLREQSLLDEVSKMEADLVQNETNFKQANEVDYSVQYETEQRKVRNGQIDRRENELAQMRAEKVAKIKTERNKLEHDRQKIMRDLQDLNQQKTPGQRMDSRGSHRGNSHAQRAGNLLLGGPHSSYSNLPEGGTLEPSLKDKIVRDQMRLNKLKEEARAVQQLPSDYDNIDILQREIQKKPDHYDKIQMMADGFANRNIPKKGEMLGDIRRQLEQEGAGPYPNMARVPTPQVNNPQEQKQNPYVDHNTPDRRQKVNEDKLLSMLDDLEGLVVSQNQQQSGKTRQKSGRPPLIPTDSRQLLPQTQVQPVYNSMPPAYVPPWQIPQPYQVQPQDAYYQQPHMMYPQQQAQPQYDPAMAQLANLLQNQDQENKKLRQVLENFGQNSATVEQLDNQIMGTNQQILHLKKDPSAISPMHHVNTNTGFEGGAGVSVQAAVQVQPEAVFPDEFLFRQNEERIGDLETEERAMMNLQAQEYDQLRVIQKLPKDSELYKFKMQQFKELSVMRAESEKMLQQQRLDKIQREFLRQKKEEDRALEHQQWLEQQKRQVLEAKMGAQQPAGIQEESVHRSRRTTPSISQRSRMTASERMSGPLSEPKSRRQSSKTKRSSGTKQEQIMVQFDYTHLLPRQVRQLKVVSSTFRGEQLMGDPQQAGPVESEPDPNNRNQNKVYFNKKTLFILPERRSTDMRIVFELQAVDPGQVTGFTGLGWTWINLFERGDVEQIRSGLWSLPIYAGPTRPGVAQGKMKKPSFAPGVTLSIRLGYPGDSMFRGRALNYVNLDESPVPIEHEEAAVQIMRVQGKAQNQSQGRLENQATAQFPEQPLSRDVVNNIDNLDVDLNESPKPSIRQQQSIRQPSVVKKGLDLNYHTDGIKVRTHYVQNLRVFDKLTIRITVQQGQKGPVSVQGVEQVFKTKSTPEPGKIDVKVDNVIGVNQDGELIIEDSKELARDRTIQYLSPNISDTVLRPMNNFEIVCEKDLHTLYWEYNGDDPMYLVFEVYGELSAGSGRKRIAWGLHEILTPDDGKIRYGFFDIPLLNPPMTFKKKDQKELDGESIGFTVMKPSEQRSPFDQTEKSLFSEQFLPNFEPQNTLSGNWQSQDALDVYIDGTRHLPDNVTLTKVSARVLDIDLKQVGAGSYGEVLLNTSTLRNQMYGMKFELRSKEKIPSTSILFLTIQTVDKSKMNPCIVGYSYFPLFFNVDKQMPSQSNSDTRISPLAGNYQMPIFYVKPKEERPFNYEKFVYLERVPTASILIRVMRAPVNPETGHPVSMFDLSPEEQSRAYQRPPEYRDGVYSTQYYSITEDERKIMTLRRARPNPPLDLVSIEMGQKMNMDPDKFQKYIADLEPNQNTPPIDLTYYSQYEPGLGIRVNIEALHDNKQEGFFSVLASVIPPASYYDEKRGDVKDVFYFTEPNYDSHYQTPKFSEGDALVLGFTPTKPGMSLFMDISIWLPKKQKFEPYGFTLCPLVETLDTDADETTNEYYVSSGVFSLPVYKGQVDKNLVQHLKASEEPLSILRSYRQKKMVQLLDNTSLIIRVVDTQRKMHFLRDFEQQGPSTKYLEQQLVSSHKFKPITGGIFGGPKKLRELVPSEFKGREAKYTALMTEKFTEYLDIADRMGQQ